MKKILLTLVTVLSAVFCQAQVTPPSGVTQESWTFHSTYHEPESADEEIEQSVQIAISGTDIYVQMINPFAQSMRLWIKGTIDATAGTATFPIQKITASYGGVWMSGLSESGVGPVVFSYSDGMMMCTDQYIQFCDNQQGNNPYCYHSMTTYLRAIADDPVVEAPTGLKTTAYIFTGNKLNYDDQGNYAGYEEVKYNVKVGFYNNSQEVYIQGLCSYLPDGWVKGTVGEEFLGDLPYTFEAGQCYGKYGYYQLYLAGRYGNYLQNMVFNYDKQTREFTNEGGLYLVVNAHKSQPRPVDIFSTAKLSPGSVVAIEGIDADKSATQDAWYSLQGIRMAKPTKGLYIRDGKMIIVK